MSKYYVQPDPKDPYVGTWYCHTVETKYGEISIDDYLFISKLNDGRYHINNLNVRNGVDEGEMTLLKHPKNDLQNDTLLIASFGPTLYYNGPVTGFYTTGYGEYILENDNLVKRKTFSKYLHEDIEVEELRHVYQRV